jgi:hypothetical protein
MSHNVSIPDKAAEWPFEAKAATVAEVNNAADIRAEIDAIAGISDPAWQASDSQAGSFTKYELTLLMLALGGPQ